jgi:hypothetical protein
MRNDRRDLRDEINDSREMRGGFRGRGFNRNPHDHRDMRNFNER